MQFKKQAYTMRTGTGSRLVPPGPRRISPISAFVQNARRKNEAIWCGVQEQPVGRGAGGEGVGRSCLFLISASANYTAVGERLEEKTVRLGQG